jgi:hypothetical protein
MWKHFCNSDKNVISVGSGEACSWCEKREHEQEHYVGKFWVYPAKKYLDWADSLAYYFYLNKNKS